MTSLTLYLCSYPSLSSAQAFLCLLCSFWKFSKFTVNLRKRYWLNFLLLGRWMADITVLSFCDISDNLSLLSCKDKRSTQFYKSVWPYWKCAKRSDNSNGTKVVVYLFFKYLFISISNRRIAAISKRIQCSHMAWCREWSRSRNAQPSGLCTNSTHV